MPIIRHGPRPFSDGVRLYLFPLLPQALLVLAACSAHPVEAADWPQTTSIFALPFDWKDERGAPVRFDAWRGEPLVLTMFFRSCQRLCPLTVGEMQHVAAEFAQRKVAANFVLVTLDPENDTSARLMLFKAAHDLSDPSWHLLRGQHRETQALAHLLGIHVTYNQEHIDHNIRVLVFDAEGYPVHEYASWHLDDDPLHR